MADPSTDPATVEAGGRSQRRRTDYPLRDYIGDMAHELAELARAEGDGALAALLDTAADRAATPGPG